MRLAGYPLRLSVFVGEDDRWHHKPLYRDVEDRVRTFLPQLDEMEVLRYEGRQQP